MFRFLTAILLLTSSLCFADTGCRSDNLTNVYTQITSISSNYNGSRVYERTPRVAYSTLFCQVSTGTRCYIRTTDQNECLGCPYVNPYYYQSGIIYNYTVVRCPIDDYVPILLLLASGLGFYFLRGRNLNLIPKKAFQ